ncbi:hypothetical protein G6F37_011389 [Rhizopus arrhizus]|nr:hypothetical protein G6F38_005012 [Rhizopus arrhizus]KAG1149594.1 hypothetical protein G6F37_011389 [Rhizopus arrhizus]
MTQFPLALPTEQDHLMTLSREGPLFILHMHNRDNRISPQFCQSVLRALQIIEDIFFQADDPVDMALITIGDDKFYSNGLDLEYALAYPTFIDTVLFMFKKLLTFCIPTVAAINGHAFAGGCMFAFAHDYRVMRTDRGYICLNEVDLPSALAPGMAAIVREKTTPKVYRDMVLQARRLSAREAFDEGIVDLAVPKDEILSKAKELALKWAPKAKAGIVYKQLKEEMYVDIVRQLGVPFNRFASRL